MSNHSVNGKIVIAASFKTHSAFVIGKGKDMSSNADCDIMLNSDGEPYIPASSFAGKLKAFILSRLPGEKSISAFFWGSEKSQNNEQEYQSHFNIEDLMTFDTTAKMKISIRDGVKIDYKTGMAESGAKYDYEVAEPELDFHLKAEVTIREGVDINEIKESIAQVFAALNHPDFRIGALTNHGFGVIKDVVFNAWHFDFKERKHTAQWFDYLTKIQTQRKISREYFAISPGGLPSLDLNGANVLRSAAFCVTATFLLKTPLIIGTYGTNANEPDKKHLQANGKNIITGKSIRGALRSRAEKIKNLLLPESNIVNILFGEVDKKMNTKTKGKLRIDEVILDDSVPSTQSRIKIDRFTGGAMDGALFDSSPISSLNKIELKFTILKDATEQEKGLLLLLLKDLWTGDLAIAGEKNIGRGVLTGEHALILDSNQTEISINQDGVLPAGAGRLNQYVNTLTNR